ncbi:L-iditol 2-dehydrogenase [Sedimentibacter acidaminivorans]|uniref:L-iditol 2-dehydrogenase n=1 Tax=Sedimentibacter acidaminivorans TaxID=913099 RepID=A0ABS4GAP3_9FIRM|nr:zinc-binding dehydrogenase [Sedimentibacter acidaminivorans]MBP1924757.1 L-iditol 2-dehydrogenase [Sedimentibacter acidaminivorans]
MKACVLEEVNKLVVKDFEMPKIVYDDDVLIKVSKVGICGSDVHMWSNEKKIGLVMGHEFCGIVVDPGKSNFKIGERVVVIPKGPRGYNSTPGVVAQGGYAEYFSAAADYLRRLPDTISDDTANMLEPTAIAYNALLKANIKYGDKVLVTGAGIIGHLCAEWAKVMGATYIAMTEVNDKRILKAKEVGVANEVFDARNSEIVQLLKDVTNGGFDKVIECTAIPASVNMSLDVIKEMGTLMFVGVSYKQVPIDALKLIMKNITMIGTFGSSIVFDKVLELLAYQPFNIEKYITKNIGLNEIQECFEELHSGTSDQIKIVITP